MKITPTHIPNTLLPLQGGLHVDALEVDDEALTVTLTASAPGACCPLCATPTMRVHSHYQRQPTDLPWGALMLRLVLRVRRFRCPVAACPRRIFTERLPHLVCPYARRTVRAQEVVRAIALAVGGEAGARLIARLRLGVSAATLRRLIHRAEVPVVTPPRVIGVDDFALRRRHRYGTVIADLEQHAIIDLLPDRTAATLVAWLRQQPQIEIVSRDRSPEYARAISEGAPQAVQVADRWHVLRNLREVGERFLDTQRAHWQDLTLPEVTDRVPPVRRSRHEQAARQARRAQRRARYDAVRTLHAQGVPLLQIAQRFQMGRVTVRRYATADVFPERAPHRRKPSQLLPYVSYLERRWAEGCCNGVQLWKELQGQGYSGSRRLIAQWVCQRRTEPAPTTPHKHRRTANASRILAAAPAVHRASSRRLVWLLLQDPAALTRPEHAALAQMQERSPAIAAAYTLMQDFVQMVRAQTPSAFAPWLDAVAQTDLPSFQTFAQGLAQDEPAILAALTLPWSNGPLEGFVNKIKTIKRQMYGRASFPMLRRRVLLAA
jgi:transposase